MRFIRPENIAFITIDAKRLHIYDLDGKKGERYETLSSMEKKLKKDPRFFRSHRSYLVNLFAIDEIKRRERDIYEISFTGKTKAKALLASSKLSKIKKILSIES